MTTFKQASQHKSDQTKRGNVRICLVLIWSYWVKSYWKKKSQLLKYLCKTNQIHIKKNVLHESNLVQYFNQNFHYYGKDSTEVFGVHKKAFVFLLEFSANVAHNNTKAAHL